MTSTFTRRAAMGSLAAAAAAPLIQPRTAAAFAPQIGKPTASAHRWKLGGWEVTAVYDGYYPIPLEGVFTNQPQEVVNDALEDMFLPTDNNVFPTPMTPIVVNTGERLIMFDTGNGDRRPEAGLAAKNMRAAGIDPADVDAVVITHFHVDHVSGIRLMDGTFQFPNAEIFVPEPEWNFWMDDANMTAEREHLMIYFENARRIFPDLGDQVNRFTPGDEILPGVTSIFTPGHTPGHTSFLLDAGGGEQMLVWGDVTNHTDFMLRHPYWIPASDIIPELGLETRLRMLDMATAENLRVSAFHGPFPGVGHIRQISEREYRLVPRQWTEDMDGWL